MVQVTWKEEFLHLPVFRKTVATAEGFAKLNSPLTWSMYDKATSQYGRAAGLPQDLSSYAMRRGILVAINGECFFLYNFIKSGHL
jgi:hypothetical protein